MKDIKTFLEILDESSNKSKSDKITFTRDELNPVQINPPTPPMPPIPGGKRPPMPAPPTPIDGKEVTVEVIDISSSGSEGEQKQNDKVKTRKDDLDGDNKEKGGENESGAKDGDGDDQDGEGKEGKEGGGETGKKKNSDENGGDGDIERKEVKVSGTPTPKEDIGKYASSRAGGRSNTFDSHAILEKSQKGEANSISKEILDKAEKLRERSNRGNEKGEGSGFGTGEAMDKIRGLYKPKIDWVNELKKKLLDFKSKSASNINRLSKMPATKTRSGSGSLKDKSYITGLYNPGAHVPGQKIIFKGPFKKAPYSELSLIVALDVSGSIGTDTLSKVFSEMDKIAGNFKMGVNIGGKKFKGKVYFLTWDTEVTGVTEYKSGEWKKYVKGEKKVKGGGGTDPTSIFDYLHNNLIYNKESNRGLLNVLKKPVEGGMSEDDLVLEFVPTAELAKSKPKFIPIEDQETEKKYIKSQDNLEINKGDSTPIAVPFILVATDGGFFSTPSDKNLGLLYKNHHDSILYLIIDGSTEFVYPKNVIEYESYKI